MVMPIAKAALELAELNPPERDVGVDPGDDEGDATETGGVKLPEEGLPP